MCQLSRESEPVCALWVRGDKHSLLSNTETPRDPTHPLGRVGTAQHLSRWESQDQDLIHGRKKHPQRTEGQGHTQLYTPERGGGAGAGRPSRLFVAVLALQSSKASRMEIHLRPITPSFPNRQPFSVTSRKLCQPSSRALELSNSRQKKKL